MSDTASHTDRAAFYDAESDRLHAAGDTRAALDCARLAVVLYAAADDELGERDAGERPAQRRLRAAACRRCGAFLEHAGERAEAVTAYQEAADTYALVGDAEADRNAAECAHRVIELVAALRSEPQQRLYLLIANYERHQRQVSLTSGSEKAQAEYSLRIARVFERRERYPEALERFFEALGLYQQAEADAEAALGCAECHHRIAAIHSYALPDANAAAHHYRQAIHLYGDFEPSVDGVQLSRAFCLRALHEIEIGNRAVER